MLHHVVFQQSAAANKVGGQRRKFAVSGLQHAVTSVICFGTEPAEDTCVTMHL